MSLVVGNIHYVNICDTCCLMFVSFVCLQGNMEAVRILYMQTVDLALKPNFLTFAILLQCHGRQETVAVDKVKQVLNDITRAVSVCVCMRVSFDVV